MFFSEATTFAMAEVTSLESVLKRDRAIVFATHDARVASAFDVRWTIADGTVSALS